MIYLVLESFADQYSTETGCCAAFSTRAKAESWIAKNRAKGCEYEIVKMILDEE